MVKKYAASRATLAKALYDVTDCLEDIDTENEAPSEVESKIDKVLEKVYDLAALSEETA